MNSKSVLRQIFEWSQKQQTWVQDALRRIIVKDEILEADIAELVILCKEESYNSEEQTLKAKVLQESDLPEEGGNNAINLISLGSLQGVDRLPSDQTIKFSPSPGMTVIYGENGVGKTGYARVLKKACRSRGTDPVIKSDVFKSEIDFPASAKVNYLIDAKQPLEFTWEDGRESTPDLSNIFVFDSHTAEHYLSHDDSASFTPFGLDTLPKLVKIYDIAKNKIGDELDREQNKVDAVKRNWQYESDTEVAQYLDSLSSKSKPEKLQSLADISVEKIERLEVITDALKSDPIKKSNETKAAIQRIQAFLDNMESLDKALSNIEVSSLKAHLDKLKTTTNIAKQFSEKSLSNQLLGTGGKSWKQLWDVAKLFSENHAYKELPFPVTDNAKCVLCQQDLDEVAQVRLKDFFSFVTNDSQKNAKDAKDNYDRLVVIYTTLTSLQKDYKNIETDFQNIIQESQVIIKQYVDTSSKRLMEIQNICKNETWNEKLSDLTVCPIEILKTYIASLTKRAETELSVNNPEECRKLKLEKNQIEAKIWINGVKEDVLKQIDNLVIVAILKKCKPKTAKFITDKNSEITRRMVTEVYCKSFKNELKNLGLVTLNVDLQETTHSKANTKFGLRLKNAKNTKVYEIASEGEKRCISLAAFLAELSQATHKSALVFDDPVSSLDHWHRDKIAKRLAKESKNRQVIVFTHDAVFLNDLKTESEHLNNNTEFQFLEWNNGVPGYVQEGLPWDCKSPKDRLDRLSKLQKEIERSWNPHPSEKNASEISKAYSWLRATIERIVERVVFGDVVFRFRSYVKLKGLETVVGFTQDECTEIQRLFQKCCDITDAHDKAQGKQASVPTPTDLATDITDTNILLSSIRERIYMNSNEAKKHNSEAKRELESKIDKRVYEHYGLIEG
jgi:wobble nucleotide-excising tRNase